MVQLIFLTKSRFKLFQEEPTEKFRDEEGVRNLEMMKMNIRRRLEEVNTGF